MPWLKGKQKLLNYHEVKHTQTHLLKHKTHVAMMVKPVEQHNTQAERNEKKIMLKLLNKVSSVIMIITIVRVLQYWKMYYKEIKPTM